MPRDFEGASFSFTNNNTNNCILQKQKILFEGWCFEIQCNGEVNNDNDQNIRMKTTNLSSSSSIVSMTTVEDIFNYAQLLIRQVDSAEILLYLRSPSPSLVLEMESDKKRFRRNIHIRDYPDSKTKEESNIIEEQTEQIVAFYIVDPDYIPCLRSYKIYKYQLPSDMGYIYTREPPPASPIKETVPAVPIVKSVEIASKSSSKCSVSLHQQELNSYNHATSRSSENNSNTNNNGHNTSHSHSELNIKNDISAKSSTQGGVMARMRGRITAEALTSHILYQVDNTGNVRVWTSEPLLLAFLLQPHIATQLKDMKVLEVGGGMTGLTGLGLAISGVCGKVVLTDGHPLCVANQTVCIALNRQYKQLDMTVDTPSPSSGLVESRRLQWSSDADISVLLAGNELFDVIIASDCLFFSHVHHDLVSLLRRCLRPIQNSRAYLLQPRRGGTLNAFIGAAEPWFEVDVSETYLEDVCARHLEYLNMAEYDPDIHFPVLLTLRHHPDALLSHVSG